MKIVWLGVYHIVGCGAMELPLEKNQEIFVTLSGIVNDRLFRLVDADGKKMNQMKYPRLAIIKPCIVKDQLVVNADGAEELVIHINHDHIDMGNKSAQWFSDFLDTECRLVRKTTPAKHPLHIACTPSLEVLNTKLQNSVRMTRFRPNIVLESTQPFEENSWRKIQIGYVNLLVTGLNDRCTVINVNQETGEVDLRGQTLLGKLRKFEECRSEQEKGIFFGIYLKVENEGYMYKDNQVKVLKSS